MGIYLNPGNSGYREILQSEYVDKTGLIALVNQTLGTMGKLTCISRPRRFGKSYAAKMLCAYYDCSCDSRELFNDRDVSGTEKRDIFSECGRMEKNRKAEEAVKNWLEESGYDYEVRTYLPGEDAEERVKKDKDTISIPAWVEDVDGFINRLIIRLETAKSGSGRSLAQIYGRGRITISGMTMPLCCRWRQKRNISALW